MAIAKDSKLPSTQELQPQVSMHMFDITNAVVPQCHPVVEHPAHRRKSEYLELHERCVELFHERHDVV